MPLHNLNTFSLPSLLLLCSGLLFSGHAMGQQESSPVLLGLSVQGNVTANAEIIKANSGLRVDQPLTMEAIQKAISRLWELQLFSDINVELDRETPSGVYLVIQVQEHPRLNSVKFKKNKKIKDKTLSEKLNLLPGQVLRDQVIFAKSKEMREMYREKNYMLANITWEVTPSETREHYIDLVYTIDEGEKVHIRDITFHGNHSITGWKLRRQMEKVKEERWWKLFQDVEYTEENYRTSQNNIIHFYKNKGFRDAEIIKDSIYYNDEKSRMYIEMWIAEGNKYTYGGITWSGNTLYTDEELDKTFGLSTGDEYNLEEFEMSMEQIRSLYMDRGYLYFQLTPQEIPVTENTVDIRIEIRKNHQVEVRLIDIIGNTKTKENVIRRELTIFPGDIFSREELIRSQREIFILNYFSNVVPNVVPVDDKHVDLSVEVEEKQTDRANASLGYSGQEGLLGSIGLEFNNFLGNGQQIVLNYQKSSYSYSFQTSFNEPWPFDRPNPVGFSLFYNHTNQSSTYYYPFDLIQKGGSLSIGHRFRWPDTYFRGNWSLYMDEKTYSNISDTSLYASYNPTNINPTRGVRITQTIRRDSRDRPEFPTQGSRLSLASTLSGGPLGGDEEYHKHTLQIEWFTPLFWKFVLYSDIEIGAMNSLYSSSVIPYDEHFFMGGAALTMGTALRGYPDRLVGPVSDGYPLGGQAMSKYSLELRFPISDNPTLYGLGFFEAGEVYDDIYHINPYGLKKAAGFGARLYMPMLGMLGFDIGYGFDSLSSGSDTPEGWNTHFIFGQSF